MEKGRAQVPSPFLAFLLVENNLAVKYYDNMKLGKTPETLIPNPKARLTRNVTPPTLRFGD
jgi:hypothetical protein